MNSDITANAKNTVASIIEKKKSISNQSDKFIAVNRLDSPIATKFDNQSPDKKIVLSKSKESQPAQVLKESEKKRVSKKLTFIEEDHFEKEKGSSIQVLGK